MKKLLPMLLLIISLPCWADKSPYEIVVEICFDENKKAGRSTYLPCEVAVSNGTIKCTVEACTHSGTEKVIRNLNYPAPVSPATGITDEQMIQTAKIHAKGLHKDSPNPPTDWNCQRNPVRFRCSCAQIDCLAETATRRYSCEMLFSELDGRLKDGAKSITCNIILQSTSKPANTPSQSQILPAQQDRVNALAKILKEWDRIGSIVDRKEKQIASRNPSFQIEDFPLEMPEKAYNIVGGVPFGWSDSQIQEMAREMLFVNTFVGEDVSRRLAELKLYDKKLDAEIDRLSLQPAAAAKPAVPATVVLSPAANSQPNKSEPSSNDMKKIALFEVADTDFDINGKTTRIPQNLWTCEEKLYRCLGCSGFNCVAETAEAKFSCEVRFSKGILDRKDSLCNQPVLKSAPFAQRSTPIVATTATEPTQSSSRGFSGSQPSATQQCPSMEFTARGTAATACVQWGDPCQIKRGSNYIWKCNCTGTCPSTTASAPTSPSTKPPECKNENVSDAPTRARNSADNRLHDMDAKFGDECCSPDHPPATRATGFENYKCEGGIKKRP